MLNWVGANYRIAATAKITGAAPRGGKLVVNN